MQGSFLKGQKRENTEKETGLKKKGIEEKKRIKKRKGFGKKGD